MSYQQIYTKVTNLLLPVEMMLMTPTTTFQHMIMTIVSKDLVRNVYPLQVYWHFCCELKDLNAVTTPIRRPYIELSLQYLEVVVDLGPLYQHHHMQLIRITETRAVSCCRQLDDNRKRCALDYPSFALGCSTLLRRPSVDVEVECSLQHWESRILTWNAKSKNKNGVHFIVDLITSTFVCILYTCFFFVADITLNNNPTTDHSPSGVSNIIIEVENHNDEADSSCKYQFLSHCTYTASMDKTHF